MKNKWKKLRITNFVKNFSTIKKNTNNIFKFLMSCMITKFYQTLAVFFRLSDPLNLITFYQR